MERRAGVIVQRTCVFWNVTTHEWSDWEVETDRANISTVHCSSAHATSFAVQFRSQACPFCKSPVPAAFFEFGMQLSVRVLMVLATLLVVLLPCVSLHLRDRSDWVPPAENAPAYFLTSRTSLGDTSLRNAPSGMVLEHTLIGGKVVNVSRLLSFRVNRYFLVNPGGATEEVHKIQQVSARKGIVIADAFRYVHIPGETVVQPEVPAWWYEGKVVDMDTRLEKEHQHVVDVDDATLETAPSRNMSRVLQHRHGLTREDSHELEGAGAWRTLSNLLSFCVPTWTRHSLTMRRTHRYGVFLSGILASAFFQCLLFVSGDGCHHEPQPAMCRSSTSFADWTLLFLAVWGVCFSCPLPLLLQMLFQKNPTRDIMTPLEQAQRMLMWRLKEKVGWIFMVTANCVFMIFFMRFAHFYSEPVLWRWLRGCLVSSLTLGTGPTTMRALIYVQLELMNAAVTKGANVMPRILRF